MRTALSLLLLATACGGASHAPKNSSADRTPTTATKTEVLVSVSPMVARKLGDGDTLFDEYVATTGRATHEVMPLGGEVTCYGGPALDGELPVELYVRRGVDHDKRMVVADTVSISPEDLVPRRELLTFSIEPGVHNVRDGDGYTIGRVLVEDADNYVQIVRNWSLGVEVTAQAASTGALRHVAFVLEPKRCEAAGLFIHQLNEAEDFAAAQPLVLDLVEDNTTMSTKGELTAISAERCAEVFAHFAPRK